MADEALYNVVRMFQRSRRHRRILTGVPLSIAQAHCRRRDTSSSTCTDAAGKRRTREHGPWFDGYEQCRR